MAYTAKDFSREQIYDVAKAYSTGKYSYHDFMNEFGCSQNTFYSVINRAIVESVVSDSIMEAIETVAVSNSACKVDDETSNEQWVVRIIHRGRHCNTRRRLKRAFYVCSKKETIFLIEQYLASAEPKAKFCEKFYITTKLFDRSLKHAIIYSWINLTVVNQLRQRAYLFYDHSKVDKLFDTCIELRKQDKNRVSPL